jgi:hypothetical protein
VSCICCRLEACHRLAMALLLPLLLLLLPRKALCMSQPPLLALTIHLLLGLTTAALFARLAFAAGRCSSSSSSQHATAWPWRCHHPCCCYPCPPRRCACAPPSTHNCAST